MSQLLRTWKSTTHLIKRVTSKSWGTDESSLRTLVNGLLISKTMYGINYTYLTKKNWQKLEILHREALRVVTGLPKFTAKDVLYAQAQANRLDDIAEDRRIGQFQRLDSTNAGRRLLLRAGFELPGRHPHELPAPPWDDIIVTMNKPLPRNVGHDNPRRRKRKVKDHLLELASGNSDTTENRILHVYTDAAVEHDRVSLCWYSLEDRSANAHVRFVKISSREAELRAILLALTEHAGKHPSTLGPPERIIIYTDSMDAIRALGSRKTTSRTVRRIKKFIGECQQSGLQYQIRWVPGHEGIEGNEEAHRIAREQLRIHPEQDCSEPADSDEEADIDTEDGAALAKAERKAVLQNKIPEDPNPLPPGYSRWATVRLRRIKTGTALTPSTAHYFFGRGNPYSSPNCQKCGTGALCSARHLLWECSALGVPRERCLKTLGPLRPADYELWVNPLGAPPHRKHLLDTLLIFIREAGIEDCF